MTSRRSRSRKGVGGVVRDIGAGIGGKGGNGAERGVEGAGGAGLAGEEGGVVGW